MVNIDQITSVVIRYGKLEIMIPAERRRLILSRTRAAGVVSTQALADELGVSELTVRRDLKRMADEGLLVRTEAARQSAIRWRGN